MIGRRRWGEGEWGGGRGTLLKTATPYHTRSIGDNAAASLGMSSWANYGLSALSNVTQSVQALSSYAQVLLHEAREEVSRVASSLQLCAIYRDC